MADSKKCHFPAPPILNIFSRKFLRLVLGCVGLIDAKGINVAQPIWSSGCLTALINTAVTWDPHSISGPLDLYFWPFSNG